MNGYALDLIIAKSGVYLINTKVLELSSGDVLRIEILEGK